MREKTKIIMVVLAVAFVGWLVFDVGMGGSGSGQTQSQDVGSVNGTPIRYQTWMDTYRAAYDEQRQQSSGRSLTREDQRALEDEAFERLVQAELLRKEYRRRGIVVTDREIAEAVRRFPPPEVTQAPDFQTDGQFDPQKYERFLASSNTQTREFLIAMEQRWREELPRYKLLQAITADLYVSDAELWQMWRDGHDSVTVRALVINPEAAVADASVRVTDDDLQRHYDAHRDDFRRPARAVVSYLAVGKLPTAADSAMVLARARALRDSIVHGADFAAVARTESADSTSRERDGSLGTFGRGQMVPPFEQAAFRVPVGQVSEPVQTAFGVHLIKVERRTADSVTARHILLSWARIGARRDSLEAQADSLDRIAAEQTEPAALDSAARRLGLEVQIGPPLVQGTPYIIGRLRISDVGVWAFDARPRETSPVIETPAAYYVFRLDTLAPAGVAPLEEARLEVTRAVTREKKRAAAEAIARDVEQRLARGQALDQVAEALRLPLTTLGPFARTSPVPVLGTATEAVGAAFRLRVGERSRLLSNDEALFVIQPERRLSADSTAWLAQREQQRLQVLRSARQFRVQAYLDALRRAASVKDRRAEVLRPTAADQTAN